MTELATDLTAFLETTRRRVDAALDEWLPTPERSGDLARAMRHIALSEGKRLRPALVVLGCLDVGGAEDDALAAAAAVELLHAYSLVHDDLPCMDDARLRRGRPCVHVLHGEAMGVLAGDALLTLAFEVIGRHTPPHRPIGRMVATLGEAAGWAGMVGGQVADLDGEGAEPDIERVRTIHLGKTAALIEGCLRLGVLAGGGGDEDLERLGAVGRDLGLAFQIVDDLLDLDATSEELGKDARADAHNGKMTWPSVVGVERARADARELLARARDRSAGGRCEALLLALAERIHSRRS